MRNKMFKRVLSIMLSVGMLMTLFAGSAAVSADGGTTVVELMNTTLAGDDIPLQGQAYGLSSFFENGERWGTDWNNRNEWTRTDGGGFFRLATKAGELASPAKLRLESRKFRNAVIPVNSDIRFTYDFVAQYSYPKEKQPYTICSGFQVWDEAQSNYVDRDLFTYNPDGWVLTIGEYSTNLAYGERAIITIDLSYVEETDSYKATATVSDGTSLKQFTKEGAETVTEVVIKNWGGMTGDLNLQDIYLLIEAGAGDGGTVGGTSPGANRICGEDLILVKSIKVENIIPKSAHTTYTEMKSITLLDDPMTRIASGSATHVDRAKGDGWHPSDANGIVRQQFTDWEEVSGIRKNLTFTTGDNLGGGKYWIYNEVLNYNGVGEDDIRISYDITKLENYLTDKGFHNYVRWYLANKQIAECRTGDGRLAISGNGTTYAAFLAENTSYKFVVDVDYIEESDNYTLKLSILDGTNTAVEFEDLATKTKSTSIEIPAWEGLTSSNVNWQIALHNEVGAKSAKDTERGIMTFNGVKVEKIVECGIRFGELAYDRSATLATLYDTLGDVSEAIDATDTQYNAGGTWKIDGDKHDFRIENGYLDAMVTGSESSRDISSVREMKIKFDPIVAGETLKLSATVKAASTYFNYGHSQLRLVGGDNSMALMANLAHGGLGAPYFGFMRRNLNPAGSYGGDIAKALDATQSGGDKDGITVAGNLSTGVPVTNFCYKTSREGGTHLIGKDVNLVLTASPKAGDASKYTLVLRVTGEQGADFTVTRELDATEVIGYNELALTVKGSTTYPIAMMSVKNLKLERIPATVQLELMNGSNTIYLPYFNYTEMRADYQIIAAVCEDVDGERVQKRFYTSDPYKGIATANSYITVDVEIEDKDNEYVVLYVLNSFEQLVPYIEPISINK